MKRERVSNDDDEGDGLALTYRNGPGGIKYRVLNVGQGQKPCLITKNISRTIPVVDLNENGVNTGEESHPGGDTMSRLQNHGTPVNSVGNGFTGPIYFVVSPDSTLHPANQQQQSLIVQSADQSKVCLLNSDEFGSGSSDGRRGVRDDRRRATHNEVERRRRDKINTSILQLASFLPTPIPEGSKQQDSKGATLSKACEYITELKDKHGELNKAFADILNMKTQLEELKSLLLEAEEENRDLRERMVENGIHISVASE